LGVSEISGREEVVHLNKDTRICKKKIGSRQDTGQASSSFPIFSLAKGVSSRTTKESVQHGSTLFLAPSTQNRINLFDKISYSGCLV
jgi:hypothetical protein